VYRVAALADGLLLPNGRQRGIEFKGQPRTRGRAAGTAYRSQLAVRGVGAAGRLTHAFRTRHV
jgi:hypothetical protein